MAFSVEQGKPSLSDGNSDNLRLHAQHRLTKDALGGLILCPIDLSRPNLRILDSGTADGFFLCELRKQLADPCSAELVGTDIAPCTGAIDLPSNITLQKQDILDEWPEDWKGSFDFVHQRHTMINARNFYEAVKVTQRLVKLVKPGGWIQLVEGAVPVAAIKRPEPPSIKYFKTMGNFLHALGMDATLGTRLPELLDKADGLAQTGDKSGISILGKGAKSKKSERVGYIELRGIGSAIGSSLKNMPNPPMRGGEFEEIVLLTIEEARVQGGEMTWHAAWGKRTQSAIPPTSEAEVTCEEKKEEQDALKNSAWWLSWIRSIIKFFSSALRETPTSEKENRTT